jgi:hypothetical protein
MALERLEFLNPQHPLGPLMYYSDLLLMIVQEDKPLPEGFRFASETNLQWMSQTELRSLIGDSING